MEAQVSGEGAEPCGPDCQDTLGFKNAHCKGSVMRDPRRRQAGLGPVAVYVEMICRSSDTRTGISTLF